MKLKSKMFFMQYFNQRANMLLFSVNPLNASDVLIYDFYFVKLYFNTVHESLRKL